MESNSEPEGARCFYMGQYCKIGRNNKVFVYRNGEWVFTNGVTVDQVVKEVNRQKIESITKPGRRRSDLF